MEYQPSYTDSLRADIRPSYTDSLMHHGIRGMHWGVRRFEDASGHLTPAGKRRYDKYDYDTPKQTKRASVSKSSKQASASPSNKRKLSVARKAALGIGAAALLYGAHRAYSQKVGTDYESKRIDKLHSKNLEGLDSQRRKAITDTIAREQEQNLRDTDRKRIFSRKKNAHVMNDREIDKRIEELKSNDDIPRKKSIKERFENLDRRLGLETDDIAKKSNNSSNRRPANDIPQRTSQAPRKKSGSPSSETIAVINANRLSKIKQGSKPTPTPVVKPKPKPEPKPEPQRPTKQELREQRREQRKEQRIEKRDKRREERRKNKKRRDTKKTLERGIAVYKNVQAVKNHDIAEPIYNATNSVINSTEELIKRARGR